HRRFSFFKNVSLDFSLMRRILYRSAPLIAQYSISIATWEYFYILIEHHGARALAISNTMRNLFGVFGIFGWAFAAASNTMVSNVIGQGKEDEVIPLFRRIATLSFSIVACLCIFLNLFPAWFLN